MTRVVADTTVYVSALHFGGVADQVLALARSGAIELFVSLPILREIQGVLTQKFAWSPGRARAALTTIQAFAQIVRPAERLAVITKDEPDNRMLECAVAAQAHTVVTGDQDLLRLRRFRGFLIVSPRAFLDTRGA